MSRSWLVTSALPATPRRTRGVKAGKSFRTIENGLKAAKAVRKIAGTANRGKSIRDLVSSPSMENLGEFAAAKGAKAVYGAAKGTIAGGIGAVAGVDGPALPQSPFPGSRSPRDGFPLGGEQGGG